MTPEELTERLIYFAACIIELTNFIKRTRAGLTLIDQMSRSSISSGLNYGEATGAESPKDFVHKLQVVSEVMLIGCTGTPERRKTIIQKNKDKRQKSQDKSGRKEEK